MELTKNKRNKDVTDEDLKVNFKRLQQLEDLFLDEAKIFLQLGKQLYSMDLYISAIINRSISFMKGFEQLANENNYITAVPIIRMQLDNCLRFYAATIVSDYNTFFIEYLKGVHIRTLKDSNNKKMTDAYLVEKLDKVYPGIHNLYNNASGYVHLSNEHSFLQTEIIKDKERTIGTRIGHYDFYALDQKVDFVFNMYKASEILLDLVRSWKFEKLKTENNTAL
jgi:hypothetical protein